jgi:NitT/TauT family transport system substrate-binding protein
MVLNVSRRVALAALLITTSGAATAQLEKTSIKFSQGWLFQATQAQFPLADQKGYWKSQGLAVDVDRGSGSATSVQRVISGTHDIAFADVGTIIKWNAENADRQLMVFYVAEDGFPLGAYTLKKSGIAKPKDLEGKKLGAPAFDGGRQMFPVFAAANHIDLAKIAWTSVDANLREQLLAKGDVDAITGFSTSALPSLAALGVKTSDLNVMRYKDYGVDGYGNALFATREFVEKNPKTVTAFVKGVNMAMKDLVSAPDAAIESLKVRDGLVNAATERGRLTLYVEELLLTDNVKKNGFSNVEIPKLDKQIADVLKAFNLTSKVTSSSMYTDKYLPPASERIPPAWKHQ